MFKLDEDLQGLACDTVGATSIRLELLRDKLKLAWSSPTLKIHPSRHVQPLRHVQIFVGGNARPLCKTGKKKPNTNWGDQDSEFEE